MDAWSPLDADGIFLKGWYLKHIFDFISPEAQRVNRDWFYFFSPFAQAHGGNPLLEGKSFRISDTWWAVLRSPFLQAMVQ